MIYFLLAISTIATAIVLLSSYRYLQLCKLREEHLAISGPSYGIYQEVTAAFNAWKEDAVTMNKMRVKMAYIAFGAYLIGTLATNFHWLLASDSVAPWSRTFASLMFLLTAAPLIVGIRSVTHGVKVDEINIAKQYPENS